MIDEKLIIHIYKEKDKYVNMSHISNLDKDSIDDIFQDAMCKLLKVKYDINNPYAYFVTIFRNLCIDYIKNKENTITIIKDIDIEDVKSEPQIDDDKIKLIFEILNEYERKIIVEHIYKGKTFNDISVEYGKKISAIKANYYRALIKIQNKYINSSSNFFYKNDE